MSVSGLSCPVPDPLTILATVSTQHHQHESCAPAPSQQQEAESTQNNAGDSISEILSKVPADKPYICAICLKGYDHPAHLRNHERIHVGEKPFQCEECGRQFGSKAGLDYHKEVHRDPTVFCDVCKKGFATQKRLDEHSKIHVEERSFICDICGKSFKNLQGLQAHIKLHTGELRFACDQCNRKFPGRNALAAHKRTHSGEKPFICDICGLSFRTKGTLNGHSLTHKDETPYKCNVCGRGFKRKDGLDGHMQSHEPPGTFTCDICGNSYSRLVGLKAHKRTHDKPNPRHTCEYCGKVFTRKDNLGIHRRLHTNELSHQCSVCGRLFTHKCRLDKHLRESHGQCDSSVALQSNNAIRKNNADKSKKKKTRNEPEKSELTASTEISSNAVAPDIPPWPTAGNYREKESDINLYPTQQTPTWQPYQPQPVVYENYCYQTSYQQPIFDSYVPQGTETHDPTTASNQPSQENMMIPEQSFTGHSDTYVDNVPLVENSEGTTFIQDGSNDYQCSMVSVSNTLPQAVYAMASSSMCASIPSLTPESGLMTPDTQTAPNGLMMECNPLTSSISSILATIPPPPVYTPANHNLVQYTSTDMYNHLTGTHEQNNPLLLNPGTESCQVIQAGDQIPASVYPPTDDKGMVNTDAICAPMPEIEQMVLDDTHETLTKLHSCQKCDLTFQTKVQLALHERVHQDGFRPFKCTICDKQFRSKLALTAHSNTVHIGDRRPFACDKCDKRFKVKRHLKDHAWCHLDDEANLLHCEFCSKRFRVPAYLKRHIKRNHSEKVYDCVNCDKRFAMIGDLKEHNKTCSQKNRSKIESGADEHNDECTTGHSKVLNIISESQSVSCEGNLTGNRNVKDFSEAENNVVNKEESKAVKLLCQLCKRQYSSNIALGRHKSRIHTPRFPYNCNRCDLRFRKREQLANHISRTHNRRKAAHVCQICNQSFKFRVNLERHVQGMHGQSGTVSLKTRFLSNVTSNPGTANSVKKRYPLPYCSQCKLVFKKAVRFKLHRIRVHWKVGNGQVCVRCGCWFKSYRALFVHRWSHRMAPTRECPNCSKCFFNQRVLMAHARKHTTPADLATKRDMSQAAEICDSWDSRSDKTAERKGSLITRRDIEVRSTRYDSSRHHGKQTFIDLTINANDDRKIKRINPITEACTRLTRNRPATRRRVSSQNDCKLCARKFKTPYRLKVHIQVVHSLERTFKCEQCDKSFKIKRHLLEHRLTHEPLDGSIFCKLCKATFSAPHLLKRHLKRRHGEKRFACPFKGCDRKFTEAGQLNQHVRLTKHKSVKSSECIKKTKENRSLKSKGHESSNTKQGYNCRFCGKTAKCKANLDEHEQSHLPAAFFCDICGRGFSVQSNLKRHQKRHKEQHCNLCDSKFTMWKDLRTHYVMSHCVQPPSIPKSSIIQTQKLDTQFKSSIFKGIKNKNRDEFMCDKCGATFKSRPAVEAHLLRHTGERPHQCDVCGAGFRTRSTLRGHKVQHTGNYKYLCEVCSLGCRSKSQLAAHMRTHTGERPFICRVCGMRFSTKGILRGHIPTHNTETAYNCTICGRGFKRKDGLDSHMISHDAPGNFPCDICGKVYSRLNGMKQHRRSHDRPIVIHPCTVCGKSFNRKDNLNVHMKIHTNELPFVCNICGKGFIHKCRLEKHFKTNHTSVV